MQAEDLAFMWNNNTLKIYGTPFDEIIITENGNIESTLRNTTGNSIANNIVEKSSGIVQSLLISDDNDFQYYVLKKLSSADITWSVSPGYTIYYKNNLFEKTKAEVNDMRAIVIGTYVCLLNMTAIIQEYNSIGIPITLAPDQLEYQFFSHVYADIQYWNHISGIWEHMNNDFLAIANEYWPISPISFQEINGPPLIMPTGTESADLQNVFDLFGSIYDYIDYSLTESHVILRSSTINVELNFYFDQTTGRTTMMYGWANTPGPDCEWMYISSYPKFNQALLVGTNSFTFSSHFPSDATITIEFTVVVTAAPGMFLHNSFKMNPVNTTIINGTILIYVDMLFTNPSVINSNITMTIQLPPSLDLDDLAILFCGYNMSGNLEWDLAPIEFYFDNVTNSIIIEMEPWRGGMIGAIAYIVAPGAGGIPGYDLLTIVLTIIIMSGLAARKIKMRNKK
ncbi:MAG: hypothetical protein JXA99_01850 [Candidatus Lokiarchaeota archaeon]|nr:hypothetical protein [Candidatus Lokiarchaeota archaeon]